METLEKPHQRHQITLLLLSFRNQLNHLRFVTSVRETLAEYEIKDAVSGGYLPALSKMPLLRWNSETSLTEETLCEATNT